MCTLAGGAAMPQLCMHVYRDSGVQGECKLSKGVPLSACVTLYSPHVSVVREALLQGVLSILKLCWNGFDNGFRHSCSVASTGGVNV